MTGQETLFSEKTKGIAKVLDDPVTASWREHFRATVERFSRIGLPFTSEDIVAITGPPPGNPNSVGAMMHALARQGIITRVGNKSAERLKAHGRMVSVWVGDLGGSASEECGYD